MTSLMADRSGLGFLSAICEASTNVTPEIYGQRLCKVEQLLEVISEQKLWDHDVFIKLMLNKAIGLKQCCADTPETIILSDIERLLELLVKFRQRPPYFDKKYNNVEYISNIHDAIRQKTRHLFLLKPIYVNSNDLEVYRHMCRIKSKIEEGNFTGLSGSQDFIDCFQASEMRFYDSIAKPESVAMTHEVRGGPSQAFEGLNVSISMAFRFRNMGMRTVADLYEERNPTSKHLIFWVRQSIERTHRYAAQADERDDNAIEGEADALGERLPG